MDFGRGGLSSTGVPGFVESENCLFGERHASHTYFVAGSVRQILGWEMAQYLVCIPEDQNSGPQYPYKCRMGMVDHH